MTIYGVDISNFQAGLDLSRVKAEGFSFVFAKVSEGNYYTDPSWHTFHDEAVANDLLYAGYHYLRGDCDINEQADMFVGNLGDARCPTMIDFEANGGGIASFWAFVNAVNARGRQINLSYIPRWYWQQIGSPDLTGVPGLIQSSYVNGGGFASALYPGDNTSFWNGFGGVEVSVLQFTDQASVAGMSVDADAFQGTTDQLAQLLGLAPTTSQGAFMALSDAQQADLYQRVQDVWAQALGPQGHGWPQLGTNAQGQSLTPVDAVAALEPRVAALAALVEKIAAKVGVTA